MLLRGNEQKYEEAVRKGPNSGLYLQIFCANLLVWVLVGPILRDNC